MHNVTLGPVFAQYGSVDHLVVMNRAVFLIQVLEHEGNFTHLDTRRAERNQTPLAPLIQDRLSLLNYTVIPVQRVLAVATEEDVHLSVLVVQAHGGITSALKMRNSNTSTGRIDHEKIAAQITMPSTWSLDIEEAYAALGDRRGAE